MNSESKFADFNKHMEFHVPQVILDVNNERYNSHYFRVHFCIFHGMFP